MDLYGGDDFNAWNWINMKIFIVGIASSSHLRILILKNTTSPLQLSCLFLFFFSGIFFGICFSGVSFSRLLLYVGCLSIVFR
jgi:hypothetical protein